MGGTTSSTLEQMSAEEVGDLVSSLGVQFDKYKPSIIDNGIDGAFLSALNDDYEFATTFENLKIGTMHKISLRQKLIQIRSAESMKRALSFHLSNSNTVLSRKSSSFGSFSRRRSFKLLSSKTGSPNSSIYSSKSAATATTFFGDELLDFQSADFCFLGDMSSKAVDELVVGLGTAFTSYEGKFIKNSIDGSVMMDLLPEDSKYHDMLNHVGISNELHIMVIRQKCYLLANVEDQGKFNFRKAVETVIVEEDEEDDGEQFNITLSFICFFLP